MSEFAFSAKRAMVNFPAIWQMLCFESSLKLHLLQLKLLWSLLKHVQLSSYNLNSKHFSNNSITVWTNIWLESLIQNSCLSFSAVSKLTECPRCILQRAAYLMQDILYIINCYVFANNCFHEEFCADSETNWAHLGVIVFHFLLTGMQTFCLNFLFMQTFWFKLQSRGNKLSCRKLEVSIRALAKFMAWISHPFFWQWYWKKYIQRFYHRYSFSEDYFLFCIYKLKVLSS